MRHYATHEIYTETFSAVKSYKFHQKKNDIFEMFAQNIDCGYMLEPPRNNLCVITKMRKRGILLHTLVFFLYKSGV